MKALILIKELLLTMKNKMIKKQLIQKDSKKIHQCFHEHIIQEVQSIMDDFSEVLAQLRKQSLRREIHVQYQKQ